MSFRYKLFFHIKNSLCLALLTACGSNDFSDLNAYILNVKAQPKDSIELLPEINIVETFIFNPEGLRDPFKPIDKTPQNKLAVFTTTGGIQPDITRRKEDLEAFPLEELKMVGTLKMKSILWALVKAADGTIHRVQIGNYMGKNFGHIIHISIGKIELMEIVPDKPEAWKEQQTSLKLFE
ncbi:MAG: pilus assembly protein PilP [Methylococcales bacterium]|jgi:type IV pilus assembly protein PilP|nr:MAG: pilus assembly protein PilP [Methylococcales bacterium]